MHMLQDLAIIFGNMLFGFAVLLFCWKKEDLGRLEGHDIELMGIICHIWPIILLLAYVIQPIGSRLLVYINNWVENDPN